MNQYTVKDFGKIIKKNAQSQRHELLSDDTNVFRIYDRNQDDFPITVDLYSNYARVQVYEDKESDPELEAVVRDQINRMVYVEEDKIVFSYRAKREKGEQHEKTDNSPLIVNVKENGLVFKTDLTSYADTGLFLDHINTRAWIKDISAGMNVLNLFSYTGSFSVYAAAGMAASVTSVDLSATYSHWAEENLKNNGFVGDNYRCVCEDASQFIQEEIAKNRHYDIIIFDPPAFSNSRKMDEDFDVQRDFYIWIKNLRSILTKNGVIMFSTNLGSFKMDKRRVKGFNVKESTNQFWADGFVKGRKGTTRSWVMALDDNSLSLDWSEDEGKERKTYTDRREHRDNREYKPRRNEYRGEKSFHDNRRRNTERRPRYEHEGRDDNRRYGEKRYQDRRFDDRNKERSEYEHKPSVRHYNNRFEGERREYESKHRYTAERRENRPRYDEKPVNKAKKKPYGYDSFKPARSRDDSSDFFWNE